MATSIGEDEGVGKLKLWQVLIAVVALLWVGETFKPVTLLMGFFPKGGKTT